MRDDAALIGDGSRRLRRLYLVRDFSDGAAATLPELLKRHDDGSRYEAIGGIADASPYPGSTIICFVEDDQDQIDAFSAELKAYAARSTKNPIAVITDVDDLGMQRTMLQVGVRQILSSRLPVAAVVEILSAIKLAAVLAPASMIAANVLSPFSTIS